MNTKPENQKKTKMFNMLLSEAELKELRKISQDKKVSMAKLVRQAVFNVIMTSHNMKVK